MELDGKVAVITGAGSGLGGFIATALRDASADVIAADLRSGQEIIEADVTTEVGRAAVLAAATAKGSLDVLVNNAGGWSGGGAQFPDAEPARWRDAMELDLLAPMALAQLALPALRRGQGAIVNISSSAGVEDTAYASPEYAAAKAGLIRFTTAVADWRERYGVRVNCIVPGWIGLQRAHDELAAMPESERPASSSLVPPDRIAAQVLRLLRDDSLAGRVVHMLDRDQVTQSRPP